MRKYELIIKDIEENKEILKLSYSSENPQGPQIQFNIQQFTASQTANAEITLANIFPYFYCMNNSLIGKQIQLYAGIEETPIIRMIGYSGQYGLIASGYISGIIPEWNGVDSVITLIFLPQPVNSEEVSYLLNVTKGQDVRSIMLNAYKAISGNNTNINFGEDPIISKTDYQETITDVSDLDLILQKEHGIKLNQNKEGFQIDTFQGQTKKLLPGDFITQPSALSLGQVALTLQLRADIQIGDYVELPEEVYVGITNLDANREQSTLTAFQNKNVFLMFSGTYQVYKIWQLGDSRNVNPQAWATIIHGVGGKL